MAKKKPTVRETCKALAALWEDNPNIANLLTEAGKMKDDVRAETYLGLVRDVLQRASDRNLEMEGAMFERLYAEVSKK